MRFCLSGFQILNIFSMFTCMIHARWFSSAISSHFERGSAIFGVILPPSYNIISSPHSGGSMAKMISLDDKEPI